MALLYAFNLNTSNSLIWILLLIPATSGSKFISFIAQYALCSSSTGSGMFLHKQIDKESYQSGFCMPYDMPIVHHLVSLTNLFLLLTRSSLKYPSIACSKFLLVRLFGGDKPWTLYVQFPISSSIYQSLCP